MASTDAVRTAMRSLMEPERLWTRDEVLRQPCPVPQEPGLYGWYFEENPGVSGWSTLHDRHGSRLLYVGIAPRRQPDGRPPSARSLRSRVTEHHRNNAEGSTLRLSLGALLADELRLELRRVGSGTRMTFTVEGERRLNEWMAAHARVCWHVCAEPWTIERLVLPKLDLPLNLDGNAPHPFFPVLTGLRADARARARALPVVPR